MARDSVTFQVLEGIDKGRVFRELPTPVTVGREEGNVLRLNDERVSRFHAKIQIDENDAFILSNRGQAPLVGDANYADQKSREHD